MKSRIVLGSIGLMFFWSALHAEWPRNLLGFICAVLIPAMIWNWIEPIVLECRFDRAVSRRNQAEREGNVQEANRLQQQVEAAYDTMIEAHYNSRSA